jgi:hypothetical protein
MTAFIAAFLMAIHPGSHGTLSPSGYYRVDVYFGHGIHRVYRGRVQNPKHQRLRVFEDGGYTLNATGGCITGWLCND